MVPSPTNPYVQILAGCLGAEGVEVCTMPRRLSREWLEANLSERESILHFHWPSYSYTATTRLETADLVGAWLENLDLAQRLGYRVVWTAHNLYPHDCQYPDLQHQARVGLVKHCAAIIGHCRAALGEVERAFGATDAVTAVIPHGNYIGVYGDPWQIAAARDFLGLSSAIFIYLFFGRLRPYKGIEDLITAAGGSSMPGSEVLIAGHPASAAYGRQLLTAVGRHDNIHIHPFFIPDPEVPAYFGAADVVVLPYQEVLSSGAAILAHSLGRPVIVPEVGCLPKMVPAGTGWLYDPHDKDGLRDAMRAALNSDTAKAAKPCLDFAASFTWKDAAAAAHRVYARVMSR